MRSVQLFVKTMEFSMINQDVKFSSGKIENCYGKSMIYSNRESKTDCDVDRFQLFNHLDKDELFKKVVVPRNNQYDHFISNNLQMFSSASNFDFDK